MTEHDFEILRNLLQDSFENNDETLSCFDYLEDYFDNVRKIAHILKDMA